MNFDYDKEMDRLFQQGYAAFVNTKDHPDVNLSHTEYLSWSAGWKAAFLNNARYKGKK